MNRDWRDFKALHGNIEGARAGFENACESLFRVINGNEHVSQVSVKQGDGGIDIFVGELGIEPITVIQCKFFLETFEDSQKSQIRSSFDKAMSSEEYELKEWVLCIPRVIDLDETSWWFKWKTKKINEHKKDKSFIKQINGSALIDLFKKHSLYDQVFQITDSQKLSQIHEHLLPDEINVPADVDSNVVLFNNYANKNEPFYLHRDKDDKFNNSMQMNNIWLFGKSGSGKTALINRNLIQNGIEFCFCDMSPVTIKGSSDVLNDILYTVEDKFSVERNMKELNVLKQITQILCKSSSSKTVIVIDELSVEDEGVLKDIANDFMKLVTNFSNQSEQRKLRFVVSTISNPVNIVENRSKANNYFQYICCDHWIDDLSALFDLLNKALNLNLEESKLRIVEGANESPRILKSIFRKIVISNDSKKESVEKAIKNTLEEIV